ncbi:MULTISPECIES: VWA domain-containing protein [Microbispora]|uniref:VWA domain-containing protein n=1 Tax=Microbispora hainanensis TaxID=568844 RepID=A0ABZ1SMF1_9ACTN|nr:MULTISPECIES: VWA domain-containing protein [Microbispora]
MSDDTPTTGIPAAGALTTGVPTAGEEGLPSAGSSTSDIPAAGVSATGVPATSGSATGVPTAGESDLTSGGISVAGEGGLTGAERNRRQVLYWRLLARLFDHDEQPALETANVAVVGDLGLPAGLLDPAVSVDSLVQRFPELAAEFETLLTPGEHVPGGEVRRAALVSKLLLNVFATGSGDVSATRLATWQKDAAWLKQALCAGQAPGPGSGAGPGAGPGTAPGAAGGDSGAEAESGPGAGPTAGHGPGAGFRIGDDDLAKALAGIEAELVSRMRLREVLADPALARQLTPSMSLVEQLLRDKANLSGVALANAKALIRRFVDEVAEVLRTQVEKASVGAIDRSVPPKRVFRNLDLDRTIWKNLTNYSPEDQRLYVDRLYYRRTARRTTPARMIVVVDQSGSMVDAMVNCTILASIFAGLPKVDVHLVAYDTRALDLTPWVHDPFEVLLRTQLGGGTDGTAALALAQPKVADPRNTVVVWISDFYEWNSPAVFAGMEALHRSGVRLIPVGSVDSGGQQSVNPWFRQKLKDLGTPVISGHIRKLVFELKNFLA